MMWEVVMYRRVATARGYIGGGDDEFLPSTTHLLSMAFPAALLP